MKYRFFAIPALDPEAGQDALNAFCAGRRVVSVDKHFVAESGNSFWAVCVTWQDGPAPGKAGPDSRRDRIDYRAVLSEADFAVHAELRNLRKRLSEQDGVPAYALFTNEQLAEMVTRRARTVVDLGAIEGVGKSRVDRYGAAFLAVLNPSPSTPMGPDDAAATDRTG
jgi:superfamily II DNA helicase RecQ